MSESSIAFADVDDDKDQDVLITGNGTARLYRNDGNGSFKLDASEPFEGVFESAIAFADVDKDKDMDVLITGSGTARLYCYNGKDKGSGNARLGVETSEPLQVRVYPNPVVETLDVEVRGLNMPARLALYDINGQLQEQWRATPIDGVATLRANVGALTEGVYILNVETTEGVIHRHRVLKRR